MAVHARIQPTSNIPRIVCGPCTTCGVFTASSVLQWNPEKGILKRRSWMCKADKIDEEPL